MRSSQLIRARIFVKRRRKNKNKNYCFSGGIVVRFLSRTKPGSSQGPATVRGLRVLGVAADEAQGGDRGVDSRRRGPFAPGAATFQGRCTGACFSRHSVDLKLPILRKLSPKNFISRDILGQTFPLRRATDGCDSSQLRLFQIFAPILAPRFQVRPKHLIICHEDDSNLVYYLTKTINGARGENPFLHISLNISWNNGTLKFLLSLFLAAVHHEEFVLTGLMRQEIDYEKYQLRKLLPDPECSRYLA